MKIAFLIPITTFEQIWDNLFKTFLVSKNITYTYGFYLGIDSTNIIISQLEKIEKIFMTNNIRLNIIFGENTKIINVLFKKAYDDNYDYFYQCNNNIQFITEKWIVDSIDSLKNKNDIGMSCLNNTNQNLTQIMVSRKHYDIFGFFFPESIESIYWNNWISSIYYSSNFENELEKCKKILDQYLNPIKKILYIGFWKEHMLESDFIYLNYLKDKNYQIDKTNEIKDEILSNYDIIICGSFLNNPNDVFVLSKYYDNVIYYITEPIEFINIAMYKVYSKNLINLMIGCIKESGTCIKLPHYMEAGLNSDKIIEANNYISKIKPEEITNKKFCCLINRHDNGKTRTDIYNKLKLIGHIDCPSNLFNNFSNELFEKKGRTNFQKEYLFSICPENFMTKTPGYVTEKLFMACIAGTIPIYYGDLDQIDKSIFNMDRIILFDPRSESSITQVYNSILELMSNPSKLCEFYYQPIFNESAIQTYSLIIDNLKMRINNFINGRAYNQSLLTNESYEIHNKQADKINGIDHIVWINLDRSPDRRVRMEKILEKINVNNTRIKAVDGLTEDMDQYTNLDTNLKRLLTKYEKACALSHIKAYSYLKNIPGEYFLILEDDMNLNNLKYFNNDLKSIILNAPNFDILLLSHTHNYILHNLYSNYKDIPISSAGAYIISRQGLNKLFEVAEYDITNNKFNLYKPLHESDTYLYKYVETYIYKYNFMSTDDETSTIHPSHLNYHKYSSLINLEQIFNELIFND